MNGPTASTYIIMVTVKFNSVHCEDNRVTTVLGETNETIELQAAQ